MAPTGVMHKGWRGVRGDLGKDTFFSAAKENKMHIKHKIKKTVANIFLGHTVIK